jgi:hypothetical protein
MPNNLEVNIDVIKNQIHKIDRDSLFQFVEQQNVLFIQTRNIEARANIELQLEKLQASLGITYDGKQVGTKLNFKIKL